MTHAYIYPGKSKKITFKSAIFQRTKGLFFHHSTNKRLKRKRRPVKSFIVEFMSKVVKMGDRKALECSHNHSVVSTLQETFGLHG